LSKSILSQKPPPQRSGVTGGGSYKPESYVMTAFESDVPMTFGGTFDPVCYVEIKSVGSMSSAQTQAMSQDFCNQIAEKLNIDTNRIYIEFADAKGYMWGWNGSTF